MIACQVERFNNILHEIEPMVDAHWEEVGSHKGRFRRHIHWSDYFVLEASNRLLVVTARNDSGELVGYFIGVSGYDMHRDTDTDPSRRVSVVNYLVHYLHPKYRGYARTLVRAAEREALARLPADICNIRVKPGMNAAREFFRAMGYTESEITMTRLLGDAPNAVQKPLRADLSEQSVY